jgi:hypothetical protein
MTPALLLVLPPALFVAQLGAMEMGTRFTRRGRHDGAAVAAAAPVVATVLSLIGLVLAFSFANAAGRLEVSRMTILNEANAIEAGWDRLELAAPEAQPELRELYRKYLDARIRAYDAYQARVDLGRYRQEVQTAADLRTQIWHAAVRGTTPNPNRTLLLTALGTVADTAAARSLTVELQLPPASFAFLFGVVLVGALLVGATLGQASERQPFYRVIFAGVLSATIYTILDMEYPRLGAFHLLESADAVLLELRRVIR